MNKKVGVIGVGDLGSQLALQIASAGFDVQVWDINPEASLKLSSGAIDNSLDLSLNDAQRIERATNLEQLSECSIVHWAVPSRFLESLSSMFSGNTIILHDSVMQNSVDALKGRDYVNNFVMAHCLMNESHRVLVASDNGDHTLAFEHFKQVGLNPQLITQHEHDTLMARTQGVFALLIELGMGVELQKAHQNGNLTPSAEELLHAVSNRESRWTPATIESILANPKLKAFAEEIASTLRT